MYLINRDFFDKLTLIKTDRSNQVDLKIHLVKLSNLINRTATVYSRLTENWRTKSRSKDKF